ncbi:MAG: hypothetical protein R3B93_10100 [Bacteroidia bacterium]
MGNRSQNPGFSPPQQNYRQTLLQERLIRHIDQSDEENEYLQARSIGYLDVFGIHLVAGRDFSKRNSIRQRKCHYHQ